MRLARRLVAVLALLGALAACGGGDDDAADEGPAVQEADEGIPGVLAIRIPPYEHTQATLDYERHPPAGGDHSDATAPCRYFDRAVPTEPIVHSLEHGAVWLAYSPSLTAEDRAVLQQVTENEADVIATPYDELDAGVAVVVTSWGRQLSLESVDDPRLVQFIEQYRRSDNAPEANIGCPSS